MPPRPLSIAAVLLLACGDDGGAGDTDDGGDHTSIDAAGPGEDAASDPDGAASRPDAASAWDASASDAAPIPDGGPEADAGRDVGCPPPGGPVDGLTPVWLEGIVRQEPAPFGGEPELLAAAAGPGCSVVVGGHTRAPAVLGEGQAGETQLDESVWFVARYEPGGALTWVTELGEYTPMLAALSLVVLEDGTTVAIGVNGLPARELTRIGSDGVIQDEPLTLEAELVYPRSSGALVARKLDVGLPRLERLTAGGEVEWSRSIGYPQSIVELADGRVLHAGTYDTAGLVLNVGQPDAFPIDTNDGGCYVALSEPDGSLVWVRMIDMDGSGFLRCGAEAADGWVAVWANNTTAFDVEEFFLWTGEGERIEAGTWQGMVIRYDLDGALAWYRGIIPGQEGELYSIQREAFSVGPSADGLVTLGGQMSGTILFENGGPMGGLTVVTSEPDQGWFARYTADGDLIGPRTFSSDEPGTSVVRGSATRSDGSAVLVGDFTGALAIDPLLLSGEPGGAYVVEVR